jgi:predicted transcriptional regulator YdeE
MKKWLFVLLAALILFCIGTFLFIPAKITITGSTFVKTTDIGAERFVVNDSNWGKWWNYSDSSANRTIAVAPFTRNGDEFTLNQKFYKSVDILILHKKQSVNSKLLIVPLALDSTGIEWKTALASGNNPYSKLVQYFEAREIKKNMDEVLASLRIFLSNVENVYGINIEKNHLKDTLYVTGKTELPHYPSTEELYGFIKKIQNYTAKNGVQQSGSPIFNVTQMDNNRFQLMAGIPVNQLLKEADGFSTKNMVKGSFMISEVTGGNHTIEKASQSLQQYFQDYRKTSMAMNFTMLVTDRILQPDSSKWITKLYRPVY